MDTAAIGQQVALIWNDVLNASDEPLHATFFELNGQSIAAVRIVARISDRLNIEVDVDELFKDPSLDAFIRVVAAKAHSGKC